MINKQSDKNISNDEQIFTNDTDNNITTSDKINKDFASAPETGALVNDTNPAETAEGTKATFAKGVFNSFISKLKEIKPLEFVMCIVVSWLMVFTLESLSRHSVHTAFKFMIENFWFFISNFSIVLSSVTLCLFFKKRYFVLSLILLVWSALGLANFVVLTFRNTPLAWVDLSIVKTALDIMNSYVKPVQIIAGGVGVFVALVVIVLVLKFAPKKKPNYASAAVFQIVSMVLCVIAMMCSYHIYENPECFANLPEAYKNYGFAYCFSCSAVNRGVDKPSDYTEEKVLEIVDKISPEESENQNDVTVENPQQLEAVQQPELQPNLVYVQLESFFDVNHIEGVEYSQEPQPIFNALKEQYSSGYLRIPGLGGGTCNAEFEVLTGMSVGMFGTCEYPYKTITLDHTAGSVAYDLKNLGYSTHAVHNHTGTFYDRHINYSNLGFDRFISVEFMHDVERNANNWAKDKILTEEIFKCINSTEGRDFVFGVSVQSHGKYPTEVIDPNQSIYVTSGMEDGEYKIGFEYFINQLYEMDLFVGELVNRIQNFDEPTVLVLYGDHLPAMNIDKEQLSNKDLFETEYIIIPNFDMPVVDEYLYAYQLNSRVTEMLGIRGNYVNDLHRYYKNDKENPEYMSELQTLMYDQLYGTNYAYGGENPFLKTEIVYGIDPLYIESASVGNTATTLKGSGFTEKSKVFVNDTQVLATYIDTQTLILPKTIAKPNDMIYVAQRCSDKHVLAQTETYTVNEEDVIQ